MASEDIILRIKTMMDTGDVTGAVKELQSSFSKLKLAGGVKGDFDKIFSDLIKGAKQFEGKAKGSFEKAADVSALKKSRKEFDAMLSGMLKSLQKLSSQDAEEIFEFDLTGMKRANQQIEELQQKAKDAVSSVADMQKIKTALEGMGKITTKNISFDIIKDLKAGNVEGAISKFKELQTILKNFSNGSDLAKTEIQKFLDALNSGDINEIETKLQSLISNMDKIGKGKTGNLGNFATGLRDIGIEITNAKKSTEELDSQIEQLRNTSLGDLADQAKQGAIGLEEIEKILKTLGVEFDKVGDKAQGAADDMFSLNKQVEGLKSRAAYFFGIENAVQLLKQGIRSTIETVKELDKAMTETAVVTDFSVGDMWDKLPQYTKMANELGVATKGVYEASTLYYQQGLKTEQVMALTNETLKMARIAGLDCAEATDLMTAALRGFNMEVNEANAQRVNDVYSELAAITAADTQEIATAMTKTASIAQSANMEFETTAALLSQIIETTREPAETAGTAMKTIIARFTEMKKSTSEIIDVEGEQVNVNKVEEALKSAGVALRGANGEFRELDDVFLELSSKWDNLDTMTQRYVATMAAGSRQQSRFIAMMSDYDRTIQLVNSAYSSSGASAKQFEKTQESLETKLNKLANAWNEFLMGISNSTVIKGTVDLLTGILNVVNKITSAFGEGAGGVLKFGVALGTLFAGRKIVGGALGEVAQYSEDLKRGGYSQASKNAKQRTVERLQNFSNKIENREEVKNFRKNRETKIGGKTRGKTDKISEELKETQLEAKKTEKAVEDISDGAERGSQAAIAPLERTEEQIEEIRRKAKLARAELEKMAPGVGVDDFLDQHGLGTGNEINDAFKGDKHHLKSTEKEEVRGFLKQVDEERQLDNKIKSGEIIVKSAGDTTEGVGDIVEGTGDLVEGAGDIAKLADTAEDAGEIVEEVGEGLEELGENSVKKGAKGMKVFGGALTGALKSMGTFLVSNPAIIAGIAGIAAIAAVAYAAWYFSAEQSAKRVAAAHKAQLEETKANIEATKQSINELEAAWNSMSENENSLESMIQGTQAWNDKLREANNEVKELLNQYPELMDYLIIDEKTGQYRISEKGKQKVLEEKKQQQENLENQEEVQQILADYSSRSQELVKKHQLGGSVEAAKGILDNAIATMYAVDNWIGVEQAKNQLTDDDYERLAKDKDTIEFIKGYYGEASQQYKAAQFFDDLDVLKQETESKIIANTQSRLIQQGYDSTVAEAAAIAQTENGFFFDEYLELSTLAKTGDIGSAHGLRNETATGSETWSERVRRIMESQGYELEDSTTNRYKHKTTGKEVNVNRVGGGMPGQKTSNGVEVWSDEYLRELEIQGQLADELQADGKKYADFFKEHGELAKAYTGDLTADLTGYEFNDNGQLLYNGKVLENNVIDGVSIVQKEKLEEVKDNIQTKLNELSLKYFGVSNKETRDFTTWEKTTLQGLNEIEEATKDFSKEVQKNLAATYLAFSVLDIAELEDDDLKAGLSDEIKDYFEELRNQIEETGASAEGYKDFIKNINSSAIKGAKQLKKFRQKGGANAVYAEIYETAAASHYDAGAQIRELISNEGWQEVEGKLTSLFNTYGKITSDDIREASEDFQLLNDVLDIGTVKASGLAAMLEQVAQGELSLTDITQDLANMYNTLYYSVDLAGDAIAQLKKAKIRSTRTELGDIYTESWKAVQDAISRGAEGDVIIDDYMSQLVGEAKWQEALDTKGTKQAAVKYLDNIYHLSANNGNLSGSWQGILNDNSNNGMFSMGNGVISWDLTGIQNTADLITKMAESFGITEEYASALVGDLTTYSDEFGQLLRKMDKISAVDEYINSSFREAGKTYMTSLTEKELENYSLAMGQDKGYLKTEIEKKAKERGKTVEYGYKTSEHGYFHLQEDGGINFAAGVNIDGKTAAQQGKAEIQKAFNTESPITIKTVIDGEELSEQMKTLLSTNVGKDLVQQIINFEGTQAEFEQSELYGQAVKGFEQLGITGGDALTKGLFANKEAVNDYLEGLSPAIYNEIGTALTEVARLLNEFELTIPISIGFDQTTSPILNALTGFDGLSGEINIGGGGASFNKTSGESFTPKEISGLEVGLGLDPLDSAGTDSYADDPENSGGNGNEEKDFEDPKEANADKELEKLDRIQETLDREAELIDKLPEELAAPLKLMNMSENLAVEIRRDEVERNKLGALEGQKTTLESEAEYLGEYYYYDKALEAYMYNVDKINSLDNETRSKVEEEKAKLDEISGKINETRDAVSGGKIQKVFYGLEKQTKNLSKVFEKNAKSGRSMAQAMLEIFEDTPLDKFKYLASGIGQTIDNTNLLNKSYKGLINDTDKVAEIMSNLEETPLGQKLGESTKDLIGHILGGGTGNEFAGAASGALSEMFGGIGDFLTFDVMEQGLDMFNQMKGMAEKAIQTIVQYIQTIANWWINREDWLYNLLASIEKEVQNLNRQDQVEERFRLYSDDGYDELLTAWHATQASLKKQIELNEQLIKSRQAELQGLNLQNILFYPAFHYNRKQDRVVENPWVYNIYTLLLDLGANLPLIGGIFSTMKSLMEDNKKRMENITSEIDEARQQLDELEKRQLEENRKYMEDEIELEQLIMDTIIEKQQEEIDELALMHDAITEGNEKLVETLNSKLELIRQQRDNTDKEEELAEKERRLAYLRQDTSGANRQEIKKLEEELGDERRDYTDELIDQKISALEEQNDKAAEQRQKQIDLLQSQLDYTEKYGLQWEEAQQLIKNGFDSKGQLRVGTDLYNMLMSKEEFTSMGLGSTQQFQQLDDWKISGVAAALYRTINDVFGTDFSPKGNKDVYNEDARGYYNGETWWEYLIKNIKQLFSTYLNPEITPSWAVKIIDWLKQRFPYGGSIFEFDNSGMAITEPISKSIVEVGRESADKAINAFTDGIDKMGKSFTEGIKEISNSGTLSTQTSTQTVGDINMEFHINSEDGESGMDIAESIVSAFKQGISNLSIFK